VRAPTLRSTRSLLSLAFVALATTIVVVASAGAAGQADTPQADSLCALGQSGIIYGTAGNDRISGTNGDDFICGLGGDDHIDGAGGDDILDGGPGDDVLSGATGDDSLYGEDGNDTLDGAAGNDGLFGGDGNDSLDGAGGDDGLSGGEGNDTLSSASGNDGLEGGNGDDALSAASGDDTLDGGPGTDVLDAASGDDTCRNGETLSGCEHGAEAYDPHATPSPLGAVPVAGPNTFTIDDSFPGVKLTIDSNGGIYPWQVHIRPAREYMAGRVAQLLVGPAFDISVPKDGDVNSATLTLPYDESRLGSTAESALQIWTFDTKSQFWIPVPGAQTVDPATNTVTASLTHFSVYAVMLPRTADAWKAVFEQTPLLCTGGGGGGDPTGIDVVLLVDTSGSMSWNDPTGLRVQGAKAFVDAMRPQDRAAVVGFDSFATREIGLTTLDGSANVSAVKSALDRTNDANGGTDISAAVRQAIAILNTPDSDGRLRVAVLLTDGVSPYSTALTTQARDAFIEIHTIGLGTDIDAGLLTGIATGTGGSYQHLNEPSQLPALYRQLAGDIIGDNGVDTDHDGISDCVERNGMFVPLRITFPFLGPFDFASFITTDPNNADTDGDLIKDGDEVDAHKFADDPSLASTYSFLVDKGLTTYYTLISDPTKKDTDGDGVDDRLELLNGTNPLIADGTDLDIEGLDLPPFTLFQPSRYSAKPAIERRLDVRKEADGTNVLFQVFYNPNPVTYDDGRNCVETCDAITKLAQERPNDGGFGICVFGIGNCVDDASQARDIVEEARNQQGIFDSKGNLSKEFLQEQLAYQCAIWFSDQKACFDGAAKVEFDNDVPADKFLEALAVGTVAIPAPGVANPVEVERIAKILARTAALVAAGITAAEIEEVVRECMGGQALKILGTELTPFIHPCQQLPTYSPGIDTPQATLHRVEAIASAPLRLLERYATQAMRDARGVRRTWYLGQPGCTAADKAAAETQFGGLVACDEFPNWSMEAGGRAGQASLKYIPFADNSLEGTRLNTFFGKCPNVSGPEREPFLVVPVPGPTRFHCGS
jgi:hypothetical protein